MITGINRTYAVKGLDSGGIIDGKFDLADFKYAVRLCRNFMPDTGGGNNGLILVDVVENTV